jgi:hypothetical protein
VAGDRKHHSCAIFVIYFIELVFDRFNGARAHGGILI